MSERWAWLKSYRVWDAVRKVFLYAENWLQPERKESRSPPAKDRGEKKSLQSNQPPRRSN
jgi:hypothetical protein